ncbi:hypothetical protein J7M28_08710 [bacterium]|nr:hypothetical protein [bacterium]
MQRDFHYYAIHALAKLAIVENVQRKVFMPFHFLPSRRASEDGQSPFPLDYPVSRNGEMARAIVDDALRERDADIRLFQLGIALHSFADTWSHEGFSGRRARENDIGGIRIRDEAGEMRRLGLFDQLARNARRI